MNLKVGSVSYNYSVSLVFLLKCISDILPRLKPWDSCFLDLCLPSFKEQVLHDLHRLNFPHALR